MVFFSSTHKYSFRFAFVVFVSLFESYNHFIAASNEERAIIVVGKILMTSSSRGWKQLRRIAIHSPAMTSGTVNSTTEQANEPWLSSFGCRMLFILFFNCEMFHKIIIIVVVVVVISPVAFSPPVRARESNEKMRKPLPCYSRVHKII